MKDVMIDLETMGNGPNAAIIAIGAVEFDTERLEIGEQFYTVVDLASSVEFGGEIDASTVMWWMQQCDDARSALLSSGERLPIALCAFLNWLLKRSDEELRAWGNGADFDLVILGSALRRCAYPNPIKFWNHRCYRTMKAMYPHVTLERTGVKHHAVADAEYQARHLIEILRTLRATEEKS